MIKILGSFSIRGILFLGTLSKTITISQSSIVLFFIDCIVLIIVFLPTLGITNDINLLFLS
jgi:hypothetical protein